ncbi:SF3a splicing factor complex subunit [Coemansia sp. RSA 2618]|nr:SF3a splicing factor complex subunit [Coemansia sp. RSA 2618]
MATAAEARPAGMIYPPVDIKTIVDKTAEHVAKSGDAFEQMIREKYMGNAKFSFIYPNDPYFAYYEHMVDQYRSGKTAADSTLEAHSSDVADITMAGDNDKGSADDENSGQPVPEKPDPFQFSVSLPAVSAQDLDVIKLTAQFVARNGREFMTSLAQREATNYQFDFLSPQHSLFGYFRNLVDQYSLALFPSEDLQRRLEQDIGDKYQILERAKRRMEWVAYEEEERKLNAEEAEKEKHAFLSIDWHDFVVVGAVEFVEEDAFTDLPPPMRLQDLKSMSLEDKHKAATGQDSDSPTAKPAAPAPAQRTAKVSQRAEEEDDDVEMEMEEDDDDVDEELEAERKPEAQAPPASAASLGPMKIRKDYVPNLRRGPRVEVTLQCQLCKLEIPASEFEEHIRVELIDPKWKEQKLTYERKIRDSNLVRQGVDIARYLKQLAEHRSDASGTEKAEEQNSKQGQVYWDGYSSTAGQATRRARQNMTAEEQAAAELIKQGQADPRDASQSIGPQMPSSSQDPASKRRKK